MNTADYLLEHGEDDDLAILTSSARYTYRELRRAVNQLAHQLACAGIQCGQRVGLLAENSFFWAAAYLATLKLGAVSVPFSTVSTVEDFQRKERFLRCQAMFIDRKSRRKFDEGLLPGLALVTEEQMDPSAASTAEVASIPVDPDQDAALMLTSGTTALPRAVRITHRNLQANTTSIVEYLELGRDDRILVVLPFFYCFGTSLLHTHLRVGGSMALCNTFAYPETALNMLEEQSCTGIAGVPSTYQTLLRNTSFARRSFPALKKIQQAGGKLPKVMIEELANAAPGAQVYVMYGQTEATARLSYLPPHLLREKLGSIGRGIPGVELRVVNESGDEVRPGEIGEIIARGDNISPGYVDDPEGTAAKFRDGWLWTGDLATIDEDGFIFITDRKSDFIKVLGHRVSSQEIEAKIQEIPEVIAAAAIGQPDETQGEAIHVFLALKTGSGLRAEEILEYCQKHFARHMVPKAITILPRLPVNAHGKVVKAQLREQLLKKPDQPEIVMGNDLKKM